MSQLGDCDWRTDVSTSGRRASRDLEDLGTRTCDFRRKRWRGSSTPSRRSEQTRQPPVAGLLTGMWL